MGTANIASVSAVLKDVYEGPVRDQLNNSVFLLTRLASKTSDFSGNQVVVPLHYGRSRGAGGRGEDQDLPTPGNQKYVRALYDIKYLYGAFRITGPSKMKTKNGSGAFIRVLTDEMERLRDDLTQDLERQVYGDGTAKIAQCGTTTSSTTVVLGSDEALRKGDIYVGMGIDIGTLANPTVVVANVEVTDVDIDAKTFDVTGSAITTSASHFVFRQGSAEASSVSHEIDGLRRIVSDTSSAFGGIDPSDAGKSFWDNVRDTTTTSLTIDKMLQMDSRLHINGAATKGSSLLLGSYGVQRQYFNLLQPQVRYANSMQLEGGFEGVDFKGKPLVADRRAPFGHLYFLDESRIKVYQDEDWHFLDEDGLTIRQVPNRDAWAGYFVRYLNLGTDRRNTQGVMTALSDATGF